MALEIRSPTSASVPALVRRATGSEYLILWLSLAYAAAMGPFVPGFLTGQNLVNVLVSLLPLFIACLGQMLVLMVRGIDLSVTSIIALASIVGAMAANTTTGWLAGHPLAAPAAVLLMLGVGSAVGMLNGAAIAWLRMPAFIVTLTGMTFFSGLAVWLTQSKNISGLPAAFVLIGGNPWIALAVAALVGGVMHVLLARSLWGRWIVAVGYNPKAAHISGVPVAGVTIAAYSLSGLLAALASVLYTGQAETGSPVLGQRLLLDIIAATILGGTSLNGGRGKVLWTLCGVLFLKLVDNSLNLLSLSIFTITMVKGALILLAALLDRTRSRREGGA